MTGYRPPTLDSEVLAVGPLHNRLGVWQGIGVGGPTSTAWPLAKLTIAVPFSVKAACLAQQLIVENGAVVSGNFDLGIYNELGTSKLASSGSTAQVGTNVPQAVTITGGLYLPRGRYWLALAVDNVTATFIRMTGSASVTRFDKVLGISEQTLAALPLPAALTFGAPSHDYVPCLSVSLSTLVV